MATTEVKVIQLGGTNLKLDQWLTDYTYVNYSDDLDMVINNELLVKDERINPKFYDYIFLIPEDSTVVQNPNFMLSLPANHIILDKRILIDESHQNLSKMINVQYLEFQDHEQLAKTLKRNFFGGQRAFRFAIQQFQVSPNFQGEIEQLGAHQLKFSGNFDKNGEWIGSWDFAFFIPEDTQWEGIVEFQSLSENIGVELKLTFTDVHSDDNFKQYVFDENKMKEYFVLPPADRAYNLSLSLCAHGTGTFKIGNIHLRQSHNHRGIMMIGGEDRIAPRTMNQELLFFFDAGDLKPPLNVYFSGYRFDDGFEGNYMLRALKGPFVLISDPRLGGGAFYIGNSYLENSIVQYITNKLKALGFTSDQLILSGLSMGTYAALYYAVDLCPKAVIIGKPLVHLGTIAQNGRINRPGVFDNSLDIIQLLTGGISDQNMQVADQLLAKHFEKGDFSNTIFAVAYMKDDDYDKSAFKWLSHYLWSHYSGITLRHKGLVGRHNDDTSGIIKWFLTQYHEILTSTFNRNI